MNWRDYVRPLLTGLVALGIVVLIIVLIVKLFTGHGGTPANQLDLGTYANTPAEVTLLIDEPTKLDQEHHQVKITVSATQNEIDIMQGYEGSIIDSRTYPNNSVAFSSFLQALKQANFAKNSNDKSKTDYRGFCPLGDRYVFTFNDGTTDKFTNWVTSCGQGTYKGNRSLTLTLFRRQIAVHDFDQLTRNVTLNF